MAPVAKTARVASEYCILIDLWVSKNGVVGYKTNKKHDQGRELIL